MTIKTGLARVLHADCLDAMRAMEANSIDAIVTDPPYGLAFMGKGWDHGVPGVTFWTEALRVAKPGAHLVAFGGTRTFHRLACAIEDAGWEIRDCLSWLYGSGFPKSLDVSKAIDKAAGAEREVGPIDPARAGRIVNQKDDYETEAGWSAGNRRVTIDPPATDAAREWQGWGTALKPAWEPIILARKPLVGTVAANVLAHGTGAINVDGCRIDVEDGAALGRNNKIGNNGWKNSSGGKNAQALRIDAGLPQQGRWPANVALDEEAAAMLDEQSGGASRFFYTSKASRRERGEGNTHPTVKPLSLMRWLVKLVTPPGGVVLDPFAGSGTTLLAAQSEGFDAIGIEREAEYVEIIKKRIA